jgi:homoserine dehydrogenase
MNNIRIGLFGYGVVGSGFDRLLIRVGGATVEKIAVKHPFRHPELQPSRLAENMFDILHDDRIDIVVEAIDDTEAAFEILKHALQQGKPLVTANKKMIATYLPEIIRLQKRFHVPVLYEAACCAGIPVVRSLQEYFYPELTQKLYGIINGSTNYILTAMQAYRFRFDHALQLAQEAGFAESDAALDVEGKDASYKLSIILRHLWGVYIHPDQIVHTGIQNILPQDLRFAEQLNGVIKLVATTERVSGNKVTAFILPKLVIRNSSLYPVTHESNSIVIEDESGNEQFLSGKGSGADPTAFGLWSDVQAVLKGYSYKYLSAAESPYQFDYEKEIIIHLSAADQAKVPYEALALLQEYGQDSVCHYYIGKFSLQYLREQDWWKQDGVSLVDLSDIPADDVGELTDRLKATIALQRDIFQPV